MWYALAVGGARGDEGSESGNARRRVICMFLAGCLHVVSCNDEERGQLCSGSTASSRREESGGAWVQVDVGGMRMYRWMYRWMLQWESDGVVMITRRPHTCGRASAVARQKEESVTIRVRIYIHTYYFQPA